MIRKICSIAILLIVLLSGKALANDGGPMIDKEGYLRIDVEVSDEQVEIGGMLNLSFTLTNLSKDPIIGIHLYNIFNEYSSPTFDFMTTHDALQPGEKVEFDVETVVPYKINWYCIEDKYFTDLNIMFTYEMPDWFYDNDTLEKVTLEITNINKGDELADLIIDEMDDVIYFREYGDIESNSYDGEYSGCIENDIVLQRKTENEISDIFTLYYDHYKDDKDLAKLCGDETKYKAPFRNSYYMKPKDVPSSLSADYKATFKVNDKIYGVHESRDYSTAIMNIPDIKVVVNDDIASITNLSTEDIEDFFITFEYRDSPTEEDVVNIPSGATVELPYTSSNGYYNRYLYGYVIGEHIYGWYNNNGYLEYKRIKDLATPTPEPTQTPSPTQEPTEHPVLTVTPSVTPIPSATPKAVVTNVRYGSSLPMWVWVVLGLALVMIVMLVAILRRKKQD